MSLLQLPFEIIESIINELDAESLLTLLKAVPDQHPEIQRSILALLLQRASTRIQLRDYLSICKPSMELLEECLFYLKRRGQLYILAEVFRPTYGRLTPKILNKYAELKWIEGLRDQDLMESARDLIKQGRTELAKRFLLADSRYGTQTPEILQIYAIEHKLDMKPCDWIAPNYECRQLPWVLLYTLELAQHEAKQGVVDVCKDIIYHSKRIAKHGNLPKPDTRQIEKLMYQNAVRVPVQRVKQLFLFVEQNDALLHEQDLETCKTQITEAEQIAKEGGLSEPEIGELMERIQTMKAETANEYELWPVRELRKMINSVKSQILGTEW